MLFKEIAYGPIHSRRLGTSLGVELMPLDHKLCTFNCVYCECGWNKRIGDETEGNGKWYMSKWYLP